MQEKAVASAMLLGIVLCSFCISCDAFRAKTEAKRLMKKAMTPTNATFCSPDHDQQGRRVVFYGGTFDPPTTAHLHVAKIASDPDYVDCVWLSPLFHPGYKPDKADIKLRETLLTMSIGDDSDVLKLSRAYENSYEEGMDVQRMDYKAYLWLDDKYPQTNFHMIVGADSLTPDGPYSVEGWRDILQMVARKNNRILVLARDDLDTEAYEKKLLEKWQVSPSPYFHLGVDMSKFSKVSSSEVRKLLREANEGKIDEVLRTKLNEAGLSISLLDYFDEHQDVVMEYTPKSSGMRMRVFAMTQIFAFAFQQFLI